eukprot:CAMPEP_0194210868 /NCGR_PEP_ID=MMETSP0156-20130528/9154_1 /TAXON_ID=33649 /ORGANISM="Thalassionema nitzschioides, Strain L26-B" /LENGTH=341 /DNA_ID=CAMNT_0038938279 /DNA_START=260 /DNA_END=1285 /DNA_ORIENTATION=+
MAIVAPVGFNALQRADMNAAVAMVRKYDPVAYTPGLFLPTRESRLGYFAIRSFWVQTGLRLSPLPNFATKEMTAVEIATPTIMEEERIRRWKVGIQTLFEGVDDDDTNYAWSTDPTLRLLRHLLQNHRLSKRYFESILDARLRDVSVKQYETVQDLIDHGSASCGNLISLVLELEGVPNIVTDEPSSSSQIYLAAKEIGIAHGLTNALRGSIPVLSTTGKLIVPAELCVKHGVKTPRYLLSALALGDGEGKKVLQSAVHDLVDYARSYLEKARKRRDRVLSEPGGEVAVRAFLPGLASETFLDRLERKSFDLTDQNLRTIRLVEHVRCALKLYDASVQKKY